MNTELQAILNRILAHGDAMKLIARTDPAQAQRFVALIEGFEKQIANYLGKTEDVVMYREAAKDLLLKFAELRSDLNGRESASRGS